MSFRALIYVILIFPYCGCLLPDEECLSYTVYPVQYMLVITPHISNENFYYHCEMIITIIANAPNNQIVQLDALDLDIVDGSIKVFKGDRNIVNEYRPFEFDKRLGKVNIFLKEPLQHYSVYKSQYDVHLSFEKRVTADSGGVFIVKYQDHGPKYLFTTRLSPHKAKYFFPCFDNLQFESVYKFKVKQAVMTSSMEQLANTTLVIAPEYKQYQENGNTVKEYIPSPQVGVHQIGFHHSQFGSHQTNTKYDDVVITWAPRTKLQHYTFMLEFAKSIIEEIYKYTGVKRRLVQSPINLVGVPISLNGYEVGSWSLLTNGDTKLAHVRNETSITQEHAATFELAQQLCRIWLGNPGEEQQTRWKEAWFKEGMATYFAYFFLSQYNYGTSNDHWLMSEYALQMRRKAMAADWRDTTPALASFNRTLAVEIDSQYKDLVTMKTASLLWMVENWIGSEKFHSALIGYINRRRGSYISIQDFFTQLDLDTVECQHQFLNGYTASRVLDSWFHRAGYPVVEVQVLRDRSPNVIVLKQRQFSFSEQNRGVSNYLIPISYVVKNNLNCYNCYQPRFTIDLQTYTFGENLNGGWIILNRNSSGYYRVNYDLYTWKLISETLRRERSTIDPLMRVQLVSDVFALYVAGDMDRGLAVEILDYLDEETSPVVWDAAIDGFRLLRNDLNNCGMTRSLYHQWRNWMRNKITSIYKLVMNDNDPNRRRFRSDIVQFACSLTLQPCIDTLRHMGNTKMDPDFRQAYYYTLLKDNRHLKNTKVWNRYEEEDLFTAQQKVEEEGRFLYRIPIGEAKPIAIVMSTMRPTQLVQSPTSSPTPELLQDKPNSATKYDSPALPLLSLLLVHVIKLLNVYLTT